MPSRRQFIAQAVAAGVAGNASSWPALGNEHATDGGGSVAGGAKRFGGALPRIKSVIRREETVRRHGGNGDNWHMSWAADGAQYLSLCDGTGFSGDFSLIYNSRLLAVHGGPEVIEVKDLPGYPRLGYPSQKMTDPRYYGFGTLALDGRLYQFMSTYNRARRPGERKNLSQDRDADLMRFAGVKLIYSPDNGRTWCNQDGSAPVVWESWESRSRESLLFFEEDQEAFSLLTVLQMGQNYKHNRDGYVYVYAPNGNSEGTMNELVMFRVPKAKILDRKSYEYFAGLRPGNSANWSSDISSRKPIHTFPRGWVNRLGHPYAWHPSVVYNEPMNVYLMANWGMGKGTTVDHLSGTEMKDAWFAKPSYLGFWIAADPWGPWTQIHEETAWLPEGDSAARAYQPQIAPKWVAEDGKSFWLVWTDFQVKGSSEEYQRLNSVLLDRGFENMSLSDWREWEQNQRKFMPYYGFNAQRVDLIVG